MSPTQTAYLFFYGIFWANMAAATGRFKPFDTTGLCDSGRGKYAARRIAAAFLLLNVGPVAWLCVSMFWVVPMPSNKLTVWTIISVAAGSLTIFGFSRLFYAIASKSWRNAFYSHDEQEKYLDPSRVDPFIGDIGACAFIITGLVWLVFFASVAVFTAQLS